MSSKFAAIKNLSKAGIIGIGVASMGSLTWKINVHDKQMNTIDQFYKQTKQTKEVNQTTNNSPSPDIMFWS